MIYDCRAIVSQITIFKPHIFVLLDRYLAQWNRSGVIPFDQSTRISCGLQVKNNLFAVEAILTDWAAEKPQDQAKLQVTNI